MARLRLAFLGSADFSVPTLRALAAAGHQIACVYTQPPRPAGRGHKVTKSPVHRLAEANQWPVRTPSTLKTPESQAEFAALGLDAGIVAAYGLILPKPILDAPRLGCLNVHASLLPRWRGAAPIQRAIQAGDKESGVTIMQVEEGLDSGPMLLVGRTPITPRTTAQTLHEELAALGAQLMVDALAGLAAGTLVATPQPENGATYAKKLDRDEGRLDWTQPAEILERLVRAFTPSPGAWFEYAGDRIRVLRARVAPGTGTPGTVLDEKLTIACGAGALALDSVQRPGRRPADAEDFLRGYCLPAGTRLP